MTKRGHKPLSGQKKIILSAAIVVMAALAMTGVYVYDRADNDQKQVAEAPKTEKQEQIKDTEEPAESVAKVLDPKAKEDTQPVQPAQIATEQQVADVINASPEEEPIAQVKEQQLHFSEESNLNWPLQGNVLLNYSMDQTIYFATLDQYKYNPAIIIQGEVNAKVNAATAGKITDISNNEETGCTVTVDLGDGYSAVYGQLKEVPYEVGEYVDSGSIIGYISEPTKYYTVEGSNLYFELDKDGVPVDPVAFFQ